MRTTILFGSLLLSSVVSAQITIGQADMPGAGDTLRARATIAGDIDLVQTGANQIWDLGDLTPQAQLADTLVSVQSTPFLYQFFFNNPFLYPQYVADYGVKGIGFSATQLTLSDLYDYFRVDTDGFRNVGFGANINGLPSSVRRDPIDVLYEFPMNFGDENTSTSAFNISVPSLLYFGEDQVRQNFVDGWGTLYLPADTFEVLRVRTVLQRSDTVFVEQFGFGLRIPVPETVEYKWLAPGMGAPVLQVTTVGGTATAARFFYDPPTVITGLTAIKKDEALALYPNPANGEVFLQLTYEQSGQLRITDATGRTVYTTNVRPGPIQRIDVSSFAAGNYRVQVIGDGRVWSAALAVKP